MPIISLAFPPLLNKQKLFGQKGLSSEILEMELVPKEKKNKTQRPKPSMSENTQPDFSIMSMLPLAQCSELLWTAHIVDCSANGTSTRPLMLKYTAHHQHISENTEKDCVMNDTGRF